jgi:hypothetical protein
MWTLTEYQLESPSLKKYSSIIIASQLISAVNILVSSATMSWLGNCSTSFRYLSMTRCGRALVEDPLVESIFVSTRHKVFVVISVLFLLWQTSAYILKGRQSIPDGYIRVARSVRTNCYNKNQVFRKKQERGAE